jgi:hypothetical protein
MPFNPNLLDMSVTDPSKVVQFSGADGPFPWVITKVALGPATVDFHAWAFENQETDADGVKQGTLTFNTGLPAANKLKTILGLGKTVTLAVTVMCGINEQVLSVKIGP